MAYIVAAIGMLMAGVGLLGTLVPGTMGLLTAWFRRPGGVYLAATVRVVIGVLLIFGAPYCRPENYVQEIVRWIGVLVLAAGVVVLLVGQAQLTAYIDWWLARPTLVQRLGALVSVVLGGLLIYASGVF